MPTLTEKIHLHLYWRIIYWLTLLHFVFFGFDPAMLWAPEEWKGRFLWAFPRRELGLVKAATVWVFMNSQALWCAFVASDAAALYLLRDLARGSARHTFIKFYLRSMLSALTVYITAIAIVARIGILNTKQMTYVVERDIAIQFALIVLGLCVPALLILAGVLIFGVRRTNQGHCQKCNYDLTGNVSGICPECGTAIAADPASQVV